MKNKRLVLKRLTSSTCKAKKKFPQIHSSPKVDRSRGRGIHGDTFPGAAWLDVVIRTFSSRDARRLSTRRRPPDVTSETKTFCGGTDMSHVRTGSEHNIACGDADPCAQKATACVNYSLCRYTYLQVAIIDDRRAGHSAVHMLSSGRCGPAGRWQPHPTAPP